MIAGKNVCAITGAGGYLGGRIKNHFGENGWVVYEFTHKLRQLKGDDRFAVPYSLEGEMDERALGILEETDLLVHCAYDFSVVDWQRLRKVNIEGSARLFKAAKRVGVKTIIVISTMSAFNGCRSRYGMAKLEIENEARKIGGILIRPGLVFGTSPGGMVGALKRILSISRIVPLIGKGTQILHLAHEEDLCRLIFKIAIDRPSGISGPIIAASEKGKTFRDILQVLASASGNKVTFIPVPWRVAWAGAKLLELVGLQVGFRSDSIVSLVNLDPSPNFEVTKQIGVSFREFNAHTAAS